MSEPENFLSRWSRRKRDADQEIEKTTDEKACEVEHTGEGERPPEEAKPSAAATGRAELPFDLKDLPPIESITAATDLRPFLAPGVPPELARAALRRAWVADPAIRNFVGLADYAWDYHEPGSMAGFEPLEMTEELRQVVARIIGPGLGGSEPTPAQTPDETKPAQKTDVVSSTWPVPPSQVIDNKSGPSEDSPVNRQGVAHSLEPPALPEREHTAVHQPAVRGEITPSIVRRGHGGALPK
jgi:Protein of unknown function (DUF3306)